MTETGASSSSGRGFSFARSGALAGAAATVAFTVVHDIFISDIWFSLPLMLIAGGLCGACIGWGYAVLAIVPSLRSWLGYNALYVALLGGLGVASVIAFEPVTTVAALIAEGGPPGQLIGRAMPLTLLFAVAGAGVIGIVYRADRLGYFAASITCLVVVLLLGMNISALGLVEVPLGSLYLIAELFALILLLNLSFLAAFGWLERRALAAVRQR